MPLISAVRTLIDEVVAEEVLGRFRALGAGEIIAKATPEDPEDVVTVVDHAVERRLGPALQALVPGSLVVGEEAAHEQPELLARISGPEPLWLIDPIDGTRNFARGDDAFGVMVALLEGGVTRAAWIALPARGQTFVAEAGGGAYLDGQRVRTRRPVGLPRGTIYTRFLPPGFVLDLAPGWYEPREGPGSAAVEYAAIVQGHKDFVVYYRLRPWDHCAGALLLAEAGGAVEHLDGRPYRPGAEDQITIAGADAAVCAAVRAGLRG